MGEFHQRSRCQPRRYVTLRVGGVEGGEREAALQGIVGGEVRAVHEETGEGSGRNGSR